MVDVAEPQLPGQQPQSSSSNKGCLIGCLVVAGLFIASILCAGFGGYWFVSKQVAAYTSETPRELPTVEYSEEQLTQLEDRIKTFREKMDRGEVPEEDLVLSADDINALIAKNEDLKGKVYVKIEDGQVKGDVSIPLDKVPLGKGRYFNGAATFDVSMDQGVLIVTAEAAEVNDSPVPEEIMNEFRKENLAKEFYKDPENAKLMRQFEDIRIEDDRFVLRVKRDKDEDGGSNGVQQNPKVQEPAEEAPESDQGTPADQSVETAE